MRTICTLAALSLALAWPLLASAQNEPEPGRGHGPGEPLGEIFKRVDADQDGRVTLEEIHAVRPHFPTERFQLLDRNADGFITPEETPRFGEGPRRAGAGQILREADTDGDGRITFEELHAARPGVTQEIFDRMDRNDDGALTPEDRPEHGPGPGPGPHAWRGEAPGPQGGPGPQAWRGEGPGPQGGPHAKGFRGEGPGPQGGPGPHAWRGDEGPGPQGGPHAKGFRGEGPGPQGGPGPHEGLRKQLRDADANGDGQVTYDEVTAVKPGFPKEVFDRMDRNGDGILSPADQRPKNAE